MTVEANSAALMALGFSPPPLDIAADGPIVLALAVRYFDQIGESKISVVPVGTMSWVHEGYLYNPAQPSAFSRLLPLF